MGKAIEKARTLWREWLGYPETETECGGEQDKIVLEMKKAYEQALIEQRQQIIEAMQKELVAEIMNSFDKSQDLKLEMKSYTLYRNE